MRTKQSDIFGKALGNTLEKGGTKAGAERGWETRRGRSPVEEPKGRGRWAFQIGDKVEFIQGDYGDARREAARMAAERGERGVRVLP
jgi:hypothetical protein